MREPKIPAGIVSALGVTQIIGYGTMYYSFSILAPGMAKDFGVSLEWVFGVFSVSLFVGGLSAIFIGRHMDRVGAATVMTVGSALAAGTLVLCALSPSIAAFALTVLLMEVSSGMVQYQAAFATLVEREPKAAARSITYLTLMAGFASTIFWPISAALGDHLSWREIYLVFAGLNLLICLPLHYWIARVGRGALSAGRPLMRETVAGALAPEKRRRGLLLVSGAFALINFTLSAILAHMVPMLGALGLGASAVVIGTLFGPAQVLSRLVNMIFGKTLLPPALALLSAVLIVIGVLILGLSQGWLPGAVSFAICLGLGSGINSIAQGSLPLYLFGSEGYGAVTGKMAAVRLAVSAAAPFLFSTAMQQLGIGIALLTNAVLGVFAIVAFLAVGALVRRPAAPVIKQG